MEIKKGGKRVGAGRKPLLKKKKPITLYLEGETILHFGGDEDTRQKAYDLLSQCMNLDLIRRTHAAIDGNKEPLQHEERKENYFEPEIKKPLSLTRTYEQWMKIKMECQDIDEWNEYAEQIRSATNLSEKQKTQLLKPF